MKLIITQPEIEAIVRAHVENTVQLREGTEMKIDFTATRSDDGIVATIDIPYMSVAGIPAIAAANEATKSLGRTKQAAKGNAAAVLGGGATPATASAANPEPVDETVIEANQEAPQDAETVGATLAQSRGPSLFSGFLVR